MANETTIIDTGTEQFPAKPGEEKGTLTGWIQDLVFTVDHKKLGMLYIGTGLWFFALAGIMAMLIRAQLAFPNGRVVTPQVFNSLFTMHGTVIIFLGRYADHLRDGEFSDPPHDRGSRYGLPSFERLLVLANVLQRLVSLFQLHRCAGALRSCRGPRYCLVCARAFDFRQPFRKAPV
jgi:hypothetical protein